MSDLLDIAVDGHVATGALNRPDTLNACTTPLFGALIQAFADLEDDENVRCVVLRGNGRAFCVGADVKERMGMTLDDVRRRRRIAPLAFGAMRKFTRPVIAQVHGYAIGSGLESALGCDLIVAASDTIMALPETLKASIPAGGGTQTLARRIGVARAKDLIFTSRQFTAADGERWGLLNYAVPRESLDAKVRSLAKIAAAAPISCVQAKRAIDLGLDMDLASGLQLEAALYEHVLTAEGSPRGAERRAGKARASLRGTMTLWLPGNG